MIEGEKRATKEEEISETVEIQADQKEELEDGKATVIFDAADQTQGKEKREKDGTSQEKSLRGGRERRLYNRKRVGRDSLDMFGVPPGARGRVTR